MEGIAVLVSVGGIHSNSNFVVVVVAEKKQVLVFPSCLAKVREECKKMNIEKDKEALLKLYCLRCQVKKTREKMYINKKD